MNQLCRNETSNVYLSDRYAISRATDAYAKTKARQACSLIELLWIQVDLMSLLLFISKQQNSYARYTLTSMNRL